MGLNFFDPIVHEETFSFALLPLTKLQLSGSHEPDCIYGAFSLLVGEHSRIVCIDFFVKWKELEGEGQ